MPTPPTPQQLKQLRDALVSAFTERSSLDQLLYFEFKKNLNQITKDSNLNVIVFELIKTAESEGWLVDLIDAARKENPGNSQLEVIANILLSPSATSASIVAPITIRQQPQRILILAANPVGTSQLRLDEELREIEQGLRRARQREQFFIQSVLAVRSRDIHRSILDLKPQIVHFSGHGAGQDGLVFTDETGEAKLVDAVALARLFKLFANSVNCVVLNACYSEVQARAIAQHINYVVGMSQAVGDRAAIEFAVGFYDALWAGESIEFAHELGCTLIQIQGISEQLTPKLLKKQLDSELITPPSESGLNLLPNEVIESRSTTKNQNDLDDDLSSDRGSDYISSEIVQSSQTDDLSSDGNVNYIQPEIVQPPQTDDLSSDRAIDYTRLRDFLAAGNWKYADYETYLVMLKVVDRKEGDWIRDEELLNFPCTDLRTINQLWVKYSSERFGFSVQKKIYLEVGGKPDGKYYQEAWKKFGDRIGWRVKESWLTYASMTFDTIAPLGHLPGFDAHLCAWIWIEGIALYCSQLLFSRIQTCKV